MLIRTEFSITKAFKYVTRRKKTDITSKLSKLRDRTSCTFEKLVLKSSCLDAIDFNFPLNMYGVYSLLNMKSESWG